MKQVKNPMNQKPLISIVAIIAIAACAFITGVLFCKLLQVWQ
jgi:hypothetical protein